MLGNDERQRFYAAAGFGPGIDVSGFADPHWNHGALVDAEAHASAPAEQWASAFPLVVWAGSPFVSADGTCLGWGRTREGCRATLTDTRAIVDEVLAGLGLSAPRLWTDAAGSVAYRVRRLGRRPPAIRLTFAGSATLHAATITVRLRG